MIRVLAPVIICTLVLVLAASTALMADDGKPKIADRTYVKVSTSLGDFIVELNAEKAPVSVQNFLSYVDDKSYDGTVFHRVLADFVIQGGGFTADRRPKQTRSPIKNEADNGLKNTKGTLAMARTPAPNSATNQFFINVKDNSNLNHSSKTPGGWGYCVFGKVIDGMDVIEKIRTTPIQQDPTAGDFQNAPITPVVISKISRIDAGEIKSVIAAARMAESEQAKTQAKMENDMNKQRTEGQAQEMEAGKAVAKSHGADLSKAIMTPSGMCMIDIKAGDGAMPKATDIVRVHYTGWLSNGTKFQSSVDSGKPMDHPANGFVKGWNEALSTMKAGGKRMLVIPPDLAYGVQGRPPMIPGNATLVFEMELLAVNPGR